MVGSNTIRSTFKLTVAIVTHVTMTTPTRIKAIPSRRSIMEQRKQEQQTSIEVAKDDSLEVEDLNDRSGSPTSIKSFPFDEQNKHTEGKKLVFQQQQEEDDDKESTNPQDVEKEVEEEDVKEEEEEEEVAVVAQQEGEDKSQFAEASLADETTAFMTNLSPKEVLNTSLTEAGEEIILEEETDDEIELEAKQEKNQGETLLNTVNEEDQEGPEEDQQLETENDIVDEAKIVDEAETEGKVQRKKEQDEHDLVSVENSIQVDGLPPPPQDDSENLPKRITKSIFGRCGIGLPDEREWPKSKREWWNLVLDTTEGALETFGGENWDDPWYEDQKGRRRRRSRRNDDRRRSRSEHRNRGTRTSKRASSVDSAMPEIVIPKDTRTQLV